MKSIIGKIKSWLFDEANYCCVHNNIFWFSVNNIPSLPESDRVLIYTGDSSFNGAKIFDVNIETLKNCMNMEPDVEVEMCRSATRWAYLPHIVPSESKNYTTKQKLLNLFNEFKELSFLAKFLFVILGALGCVAVLWFLAFLVFIMVYFYGAQ